MASGTGRRARGTSSTLRQSALAWLLLPAAPAFPPFPPCPAIRLPGGRARRLAGWPAHRARRSSLLARASVDIGAPPRPRRRRPVPQRRAESASRRDAEDAAGVNNTPSGHRGSPEEAAEPNRAQGLEDLRRWRVANPLPYPRRDVLCTQLGRRRDAPPA